MRAILIVFLTAHFWFHASAAELDIPGHTAYTLPDPHSARIEENRGVSRWRDAKQSINWYGEFFKTGELSANIVLRTQGDVATKLRLTVGEQSKEVTVTPKTDQASVIDFGNFEVKNIGFQRFSLESLDDPTRISLIQTLRLNGPAIEGAHFNMLERRNAASVHLSYKTPAKVEAKAFYCEVTGVDEPTATFYMACGWHRGYFGMQVNSPTERRIIFSVWDSGSEAISRDKVADENRVKLVGKGEGVYSGDFGNEGTGGHSHLKYMWKTGEKQRFLVTAEPSDKTFTTFSGYWFHPENQSWMLISSWKAPREGGYLRGLHSFSENFDGANGHLRRKALYGNQWLQDSDGKWQEITQASFSHDATGRKDRRDRFMGVENGQFFLSHGGYVPGFNQFGDLFDRPATGVAPDGLELPAIK